MRESAEAAFILLCARGPKSRHPEALAEAASAVRDWASVAEISGRHRVAAIVLDAVMQSEIAIPLATRQALLRMSAQARGLAMQLDRELGPIAAALREASVPLIVLKGPALSRTTYPTASMRPYDDLDLLVQDKDEDTAVAVMRRLGFAEIPDDRENDWCASAGQAKETAHYHRRFCGIGGRMMVELHTDPLQLGLSPMCEQARWQRAIAVPGTPGVLTLCPTDQLVQLSVHAHKHGFSRLIWLKDLDLLLQSHAGDIDWETVTSVARQEGVAGSVWFSLRLTEKLLHTPLPPNILASLRPAPWIRALYHVTWPEASIAGLNGRMRRRALQVRGSDCMRGTIPGVFLMGRRRTRAGAALHAGTHRLRASFSKSLARSV
jgi:hypothetical protein